MARQPYMMIIGKKIFCLGLGVMTTRRFAFMMTCDEIMNIVKFLDRGVEAFTVSARLSEKAENWLTNNGYKITQLEEIEAVMISKSEKTAEEADAEIKVGGTTYEG